MSTLRPVELGVLGPLQVRRDGTPVTIPGAKPRAILTMLGLHSGSVVSADTLIELLWGDDPPRTAAKALQTHISSLRRILDDGLVLTEGTGWILGPAEVDAPRYRLAAKMGREAAAVGDTGQAAARFEEAVALWRGTPELPDGKRGASEKTRWIEAHAALVEDRADALLATGRAAEIIGELEAAVAEAPLRERRWGQLMLALYRAGRQGEALGAYQRARSLLADELGVDPGPNLRRLEALIVAQDAALEVPVSQQLSSVTRAVTFLLTDIEGSTAAWEADASAMAVALARHDELVEQIVTSRGGRLIKTRGEGDATFSVFDRPSAAAAAAIELQDAMSQEPWALREPMRIRVALHTGEAELRDGDYFGRAVNRAARLRSLTAGGQILCSGAIAELVIDSLSDDVVLADLGTRQLKNLARPEHVFELRLETADDVSREVASDVPIERPDLPAVLAGPGPFVGRGVELERLLSAWQSALAGGMRTVLIAGEPGVGKTRLAGEWSRQAYEQGAVVLYGRCDEDLGAPYQPFAEALRSLVPCLGSSRLRGLRAVEALLPMVPALTDVVPDLAVPPRADPDTERYALFDAVVALLDVASTSAPIVLILDDLHWAAKPTLLLLRHLLRFGEHSRVQIVGTYRSTDLDRSHPLAAMLADLHRDGTANRLQLSGLDEDDVTAYVVEAGYDDEELARALASVTGGNPFFLIEALRHVDESGGVWDPSTLPQGVRETVSRRLSRLPAETNKALAAAAVVGSRFSIDLVEQVVDEDLVDAFDEACKAGIVIEEPGGRYRFNHAIVRQSLLAELASVRRMRLHQRIATTLETQPGADDEVLAELAHHYFECAWAGNAAKAVHYCRRAADQAMARLAYEGAADLYDRALHALEEIDDELPDRDDQQAELLIARCEALLAAGDVALAAGSVSQLQEATHGSARLAAWATCFDGQLSMLTHPERLDDIEAALSEAAGKLAGLDDAAGEATAHTARAACLARLGRIADCETALDDALTAARRGRDHRRVNAVLAGAPLAALWGPNPVPRAGGRCLDVVRLLRITTDSPAVEATSTRCQAVLEAFRGRAAAARRMIESARRTVTELGLRHALLEVEQFAGIVELVANDPASAEPHLRQAYKGFRRMGLDTDTAETAALLGRACLPLERDAEADELCTESERLAGHALKASIAWRTLRARLLSRRGSHDEARRVAEEAVSLAERTDALVDNGDACLTLAKVLDVAGDAGGARAAAERAIGLYELKGAAALAEKARRILGERAQPSAPVPPEAPVVEPDNACVRAINQLVAAVDRESWDEVEQLLAAEVVVDSRRKIVGFERIDLPSGEWLREMRRFRQIGMVRYGHSVIAVRCERLALIRLEVGTSDVSPGAPQDEILRLFGLDEEGRIALQVSFDIEDIDAAIAELDAAHARFERQTPRTPLENAATRADDRLITLLGENRLDEIGALFAEDTRLDDRRHGLHRESDDRATAVDNIRAIAALGVAVTKATLALRGDRLCLSHMRFEDLATRPAAFCVEALEITEVDADELMVAKVVFDLDDVDAAFEELDARYLAGEAAAHANTWSAVAKATAAVNQHEVPPTTPHWVNIDHRLGTAFAAGDAIANIRVWWNLTSEAKTYIEAVHRLSDLGAVVSYSASGTSQEGFDAEWRLVELLTVEGDLFNRCEIFDEADIDAALARFDELSRPAQHLENAASQLIRRFWMSFLALDWKAVTAILADDISVDDRRPIVNYGLLHGPDSVIEALRAAPDMGVGLVTTTVIATRGELLALVFTRFSSRDQRFEAFDTELIDVVEINGDNQISAIVVFEPDDTDAAFEELDARYLAGQAAAHANTWSVVVQANAALNRRELPATTPNYVSIDHRRGTAFAPGDLSAYIRAAWDVSQDLSNSIEAVHRLSDFGVVFTHAARGSSHEGFDAEWRVAELLTIEGELINRCELFDETDLDTALARFEQLSRPAQRLENAASRVDERFQASFAARDWDAMGDLLADDISADDRRRVVNAGVRHGRDAKIADMRATADLGTKNGTSTVIAIRGQRLALVRIRLSGRDPRPDAFHTEMLGLAEINADNRMATRVLFDVDDIDAACEELDARYLAGEAAPHSHTWSVINRAYAAASRHEMPPTTTDWVNIDHRKGRAFVSGEGDAYMRAAWDVTPDICYRIEAVHRLNNLGAVVTHVSKGTSPDGFAAEWRTMNLYTVHGDLIDRCELFDEADLESALARFEQLSLPAQRLENTASQVAERYCAYFAARDWTAMAQILAHNISVDDRRRVVGAGVRHGRDVEIAIIRAGADLGGTDMTSTVIATRGERLILTRTLHSGPDQAPEGFHVDVLAVVEIDTGDRIVARVVFDPDDLDAAFEELEARHLAGEAAAHAHTWSVIERALVSFNRHEFPPTTADSVNIDHRRGAALGSGDLTAYIRAGWDVTPDVKIYFEAVHRLSNRGAVVTQAAYGTSQEGFDAEWRMIDIFTVEGDLIDRREVYDEADIDAALARFEELHPQAPRLECAASRAYERVLGSFAARDWNTLAELLADRFSSDDRRRVVNAGIRRGKDAAIDDARANADLGITVATSAVVATRGERLALTRARYAGSAQGVEAFHADVLDIIESDADERVVARVIFDPDDIDAAFAELDARYLTGEAAVHAHAWSLVTAGYTSLIRREVPAAAPDYVIVDHRLRATIEARDFNAYLRASWDLTPDLRMYVEAVHRLSDLGAVVTNAAYGTSQDGFEAEWRMIELLEVGRDLINRCELFDEADIDEAIARFEQLSPPVRRLENAASRVVERFQACFAVRDWDAMAEVLADGVSAIDRRPVMRAGTRRGRDINIGDWRAVAEVGLTNMTSTVVATRGERLVLGRFIISTDDQRPDAFHNYVLGIAEINADNRIATCVMFEIDDIDAAFDELDARFLAGEAAPYSDTWTAVTSTYAATNAHELPAATPDWVNIDHRRGITFAPGDLPAYVRAAWDLAQDGGIYIEAVHRLNNLGAVVTHVVYGTSRGGFDAEWREVILLTFEGAMISCFEMFDEADLDAAIARFDELNRPPLLGNSATQAKTRVADTLNRRDFDGFRALASADARYEDRRKGLRYDGPFSPQVAHALFEATRGWRLEMQPVAIRDSRLALTRDIYRDTNDVDRPITGEHLTVTEVGNDDLVRSTVLFDPDDIDGAFAELTARWIASREVAHPAILESVDRLNETVNRHDWDAIAAHFADATYVNHRQLANAGNDTVADWLSSMRTIGSLIPDFWVELAEVLACSATGIVGRMALKGTSTDGAAIEIPYVLLILLDGDRVTHFEAFDEDQRDVALARFQELSQA